MKKRVLFRIVTLLLVASFGLAVAEWLVRRRQHSILSSDQLNPGLIRPDARLGWCLTPGWKGGHRHHDFNVRYVINQAGFRFDPAQADGRPGERIAVVGDSFTFGFGVNDDQTFVSLLNRQGTNTHLNMAVPGFSTDQEALLIGEEVLKLRPNQVWLVVYVGNDLLDNQFARPIQMKAAKPYFELLTNRLVLRNVPVPPPAKGTDRTTPPNLRTLILGEVHDRLGLWGFVAEHSALIRLVREEILPDPDCTAAFAARFEPAIGLFAAILDRIHQQCVEAGARLSVAVLAGRSFVEKPRSLSAQYQECFVAQVLSACATRGIPTMDLAHGLRRSFQASRTPFFHQNDGHLTPLGHAAVYGLIARPAANAQQ